MNRKFNLNRREVISRSLVGLGLLIPFKTLISGGSTGNPKLTKGNYKYFVAESGNLG